MRQGLQQTGSAATGVAWPIWPMWGSATARSSRQGPGVHWGVPPSCPSAIVASTLLPLAFGCVFLCMIILPLPFPSHLVILSRISLLFSSATLLLCKYLPTCAGLHPHGCVCTASRQLTLHYSLIALRCHLSATGSGYLLKLEILSIRPGSASRNHGSHVVERTLVSQVDLTSACVFSSLKVYGI